MIMLNDVLQIVQSFFRSPERFGDLADPSGLLPDGIGGVLQLVADGKPAQLKDGSGALIDVSPEELQKMLSFFMENVFFLPEGTHYRVLGLNPGASPAKIRHHYSLLLRLFYFDRDDRASEWDTERAMRINHAYSILRDQDRRHSYDQHLREQGFVFSESKDRYVEGVDSNKGSTNNFVRLQSVTSSLPVDTNSNDVGLAERGKEPESVPPSNASRKPDDDSEENESAAVSSVGGASNAPFVSNNIARAYSNEEDSSQDSASERPSQDRSGRTHIGTQSTRLVIEADDAPQEISETRASTPLWRRYGMIWGPGVAVGLLIGIGVVMYGEKTPPTADVPTPVLDLPSDEPVPVLADVLTPGETEQQEVVEAIIDSPVEQVSAVSPNVTPVDTPVVEGHSTITFDFTSDSWVEVTDANNEKLFLNIGKAGDSRTVEGVAPFSILMGNARGVVMKYNGQPYDHYVHIRKGMARFTLGDPQPGLENSAEKSADSSGVGEHSPESGAVEEYALDVQQEPVSEVTVADSVVEESTATVAAATLAGTSSQESIIEDHQEDTAPGDVGGQDASVNLLEETLIENPAQPAETEGSVEPVVDLLAGSPGGGSEIIDSTTVESLAPVVESEIKSNISLQELNDLVFDFMRTYEVGDLESFITLFSRQAHTNDRSDREGIKKDYRELFDITEKRQFIISKLRWERDLNTARGEGEFQVNIQLKSNHRLSSYVGKVMLHVKKGSRRVLITRLVHEYAEDE